MKKIIVTGHKGFIGVHLVRLLKEQGYYVIGIDTNYFNDECNFLDYVNPDKEIIKDIRDINEEDLKEIYAVCHLAGLSNDPMGELNENLTYDINYEASKNLALLSKKVGVERFIFSSSCSMYGIADGDNALDESAEFAPVTAYAISKVKTEIDVQNLGSESFSVTFLRNATAYGVSPKLRLDLVVNNLVGWAVTSGNIKIMSDGTPWRPLVHAEDIARAFVATIDTEKKDVNGKSFNVGQNGENYQIKDIAKMVGEVIPNCKVEITGEHGSDSRSYKVDFSKITNELPKFKPKWKLRDGIEEIYKSYVSQGMNEERFNGRYFIRLKQLEYLSEKKVINDSLYWV
jgi:nucleoside-diphosphate-sugar epimerase